MFIIPSIDQSMKLSLSEVFVSNIIVTMVISNKSCCKHVLFTNLSDFISTTTRVTSVKSKKFLFCSFPVAKFGFAPKNSYTYICDLFYLLGHAFLHFELQSYPTSIRHVEAVNVQPNTIWIAEQLFLFASILYAYYK